MIDLEVVLTIARQIVTGLRILASRISQRIVELDPYEALLGESEEDYEETELTDESSSTSMRWITDAIGTSHEKAFVQNRSRVICCAVPDRSHVKASANELKRTFTTEELEARSNDNSKLNKSITTSNLRDLNQSSRRKDNHFLEKRHRSLKRESSGQSEKYGEAGSSKISEWRDELAELTKSKVSNRNNTRKPRETMREKKDIEEERKFLQAKIEKAMRESSKSCCGKIKKDTLCTPIFNVNSRLRVCTISKETNHKSDKFPKKFVDTATDARSELYQKGTPSKESTSIKERMFTERKTNIARPKKKNVRRHNSKQTKSEEGRTLSTAEFYPGVTTLAVPGNHEGPLLLEVSMLQSPPSTHHESVNDSPLVSKSEINWKNSSTRRAAQIEDTYFEEPSATSSWKDLKPKYGIPMRYNRKCICEASHASRDKFETLVSRKRKDQYLRKDSAETMLDEAQSIKRKIHLSRKMGESEKFCSPSESQKELKSEEYEISISRIMSIVNVAETNLENLKEPCIRENMRKVVRCFKTFVLMEPCSMVNSLRLNHANVQTSVCVMRDKEIDVKQERKQFRYVGENSSVTSCFCRLDKKSREIADQSLVRRGEESDLQTSGKFVSKSASIASKFKKNAEQETLLMLKKGEEIRNVSTETLANSEVTEKSLNTTKSRQLSSISVCGKNSCASATVIESEISLKVYEEAEEVQEERNDITEAPEENEISHQEKFQNKKFAFKDQIFKEKNNQRKIMERKNVIVDTNTRYPEKEDETISHKVEDRCIQAGKSLQRGKAPKKISRMSPRRSVLNDLELINPPRKCCLETYNKVNHPKRRREKDDSTDVPITGLNDEKVFKYEERRYLASTTEKFDSQKCINNVQQARRSAKVFKELKIPKPQQRIAKRYVEQRQEEVVGEDCSHDFRNNCPMKKSSIKSNDSRTGEHYRNDRYRSRGESKLSCDEECDKYKTNGLSAVPVVYEYHRHDGSDTSRGQYAEEEFRTHPRICRSQRKRCRTKLRRRDHSFTEEYEASYIDERVYRPNIDKDSSDNNSTSMLRDAEFIEEDIRTISDLVACQLHEFTSEAALRSRRRIEHLIYKNRAEMEDRNHQRH